MKHPLVMLFLLTLAGCATQPRVYHSGIAKSPYVLTLDPNGAYCHAQTFSDGPAETGRWWPVTDEVVILMPDQTDKQVYYACIREERSPFGNYWPVEDLREAMDGGDPKIRITVWPSGLYER